MPYLILFYFCAGQHSTLLCLQRTPTWTWGSVGRGRATALIQTDAEGGNECGTGRCLSGLLKSQRTVGKVHIYQIKWTGLEEWLKVRLREREELKMAPRPFPWVIKGWAGHSWKHRGQKSKFPEEEYILPIVLPELRGFRHGVAPMASVN